MYITKAISFLWTIPIHHAHFEELHKNRIQIYSICTWPKYMITSESFNERNILCIIFEQLLQAHIPSLQISIRLNSMLRPWNVFLNLTWENMYMRVPSPMAEGRSKSSSSIVSQKREKNTNASLRMSSTSEAIQSTEQKPQSGWYGIFLHYENKIKTIEGLIIKKKKAKAKRSKGALKCLCLHSAEFPHRVHPKNKKRVRQVFKGCGDKVGHWFSYLGLLFLSAFEMGQSGPLCSMTVLWLNSFGSKPLMRPQENLTKFAHCRSV